MGFTHYPKLPEGYCVFGSVLWFGAGDPRNTLHEPLAPGASAYMYGSSTNFTRFFGSAFCDQVIDVSFDFANDFRMPLRVPDGKLDLSLPSDLRELYAADEVGLREITDEDLPYLYYDAKALDILGHKAGTPKGMFVPIYGMYLRVTVTNRGEVPVSALRVVTVCSVF